MKSYTQPSDEIKDAWVNLGDATTSWQLLTYDEYKRLADQCRRRDLDAVDVIDDVGETIRAGAKCSDWDMAFVAGLAKQRCQVGSRLQLSPRQWSQLWRIAELVKAPYAELAP